MQRNIGEAGGHAVQGGKTSLRTHRKTMGRGSGGMLGSCTDDADLGGARKL
jgi:hypothetical protein